jgi:hypothetical protein
MLAALLFVVSGLLVFYSCSKKDNSTHSSGLRCVYIPMWSRAVCGGRVYPALLDN